MGKKKDKKNKLAAQGVDLESEVRRLRKENEELRARLAKIAELTIGVPDVADIEIRPAAAGSDAHDISL